MHFDPGVTLAGFIVGIVVGMTGMGGGALMTPILVLVFGITPLTAVSSDLVASMIMKPIGSAVHVRKKTVRWEIVRWLVIGSVPFAFAGVFVLRALSNSDSLQGNVKIALGVALVLAAALIVVKGYMQYRRNQASGHAVRSSLHAPVQVRPIPLLIIGAVGGLIVGMTSVGSGSLIIVCLMFLYPQLAGSELVGTDLVQAVPLVAAAALGHILYGDFQLGLTASLLLGSIPGVYLGARLSSRARDGVVRPALVFVLLASGLKLLNVPTEALGWILLGVAVLGLPIWGAFDARQWSQDEWQRAHESRSKWMRWQVLGAPFVVGAVATVAYFTKVRPKLLEASGIVTVVPEVALA